MRSDHQQEAELFGYYLVSRRPDELSVSLYEHAMRKQTISLNEKDRRVLRFVMKHKWSLGLVDAGLCMFHKNSGVRKKMFLMLSILETSPLYSGQFLPERRSPLYALLILWVGTRAVLKALAGGLLLRLL
jgi:hypothetical protein